MENGLVEVTEIGQLKENDYAVRVTLNGNSKVYKVDAFYDFQVMLKMSKLMQYYLNNYFDSTLELEVAQYLTPLRQRLVKTITVK